MNSAAKRSYRKKKHTPHTPTRQQQYPFVNRISRNEFLFRRLCVFFSLCAGRFYVFFYVWLLLWACHQPKTSSSFYTIFRFSHDGFSYIFFGSVACFRDSIEHVLSFCLSPFFTHKIFDFKPSNDNYFVIHTKHRKVCNIWFPAICIFAPHPWNFCTKFANQIMTWLSIMNVECSQVHAKLVDFCLAISIIYIWKLCIDI